MSGASEKGAPKGARGFPKVTPGAWFRLERLAKASAAAWEEGNNSRDPEVLRSRDAICAFLREKHDALAAEYGLEVDWPGLRPHYRPRWGGAL